MKNKTNIDIFSDNYKIDGLKYDYIRYKSWYEDYEDYTEFIDVIFYTQYHPNILLEYICRVLFNKKDYTYHNCKLMEYRIDFFKHTLYIIDGNGKEFVRLYNDYLNTCVSIDCTIEGVEYDILVADTFITNIDIFIREKKLKYIETL